MKWEEWDELVRRLDRSAQAHPRAYRIHVGLLALFGYAYLVAAVLLLLGASAGIVLVAVSGALLLIKLAIPLIALAWPAIRSIWVRVPPPEQGIRLDPSDAPELFQTVNDVRREVGGPKVHEIRVTEDFNAAITQVPRLGLIGWPRNYLLIGLPLMQGLTSDQLRSVLAHEYGHLSHRHSRFTGWIYRLRRTWSDLLARLEQSRRRGGWIFRRFFEWYSPYFSAYTFALARQQEYEADMTSARLVGVEAAAASLVAVNVGASFVEDRYWPSVFRRAEEEPDPPFAFRSLISSLPVRRDESVESLLEAALARETDTADTHPSLSDRLSALGVDASSAAELIPSRDGSWKSAAAELLGDHEQRLAERFDAQWRQAVADQWRERHADTLAARKRFEELQNRKDTVDSDELRELAQLTERFNEPAAAIPLYGRLLQQLPDDPVGHYRLGLVLLEMRDDEGLQHLDRAMDADPEAILPGCEVAYAYLKQQGREEDAERYVRRAEEASAVLAEAQAERDTIDPHDPLEPHGLSASSLEAVRRQLELRLDVRTAFLARKRLRRFADRDPLYVVGVDPQGHGVKPAELIKELSQTLQLPGGFFVVDLSSRKYKPLAAQLREIDGAQIKSQ